MRVYKIWVADDEICRDKLTYVLTNINIHHFCRNHCEFTLTPDRSEADLAYGRLIKLNHIPQKLKMIASAHLLKKKLEKSTYTIKSITSDGKTLHFIKKEEQVDSDCPEYILPDLFETLFFHWSRYEEVVFPIDKRDEWDLMPENELLAIKEKIYKIPFIDDLIEWFIRKFENDLHLNKKFEIIKTYDIDYLHFDELDFVQNLKIIGSILLKGNNKRKGVFDFLKNWLNGEIDYSFLANDDSKKIIFILLAGNHKYDFKKDAKALSRIKQLVEITKNNGHDLGLHPSFATCYSKAQFEKEVDIYRNITGEEVSMTRQHFLHFDHIETVTILEDLSIREDFSMGYNTFTGYKIGTSERFYYWNWKSNRRSQVSATPFVWMDTAQYYEDKRERSTQKYSGFEKSIFDNSKVHIILHPHFQNMMKYKYV